jgi:hypothetical protein
MLDAFKVWSNLGACAAKGANCPQRRHTWVTGRSCVKRKQARMKGNHSSMTLELGLGRLRTSQVGAGSRTLTRVVVSVVRQKHIICSWDFAFPSTFDNCISARSAHCEVPFLVHTAMTSNAMTRSGLPMLLREHVTFCGLQLVKFCGRANGHRGRAHCDISISHLGQAHATQPPNGCVWPRMCIASWRKCSSSMCTQASPYNRCTSRDADTQ